MDEGDIIDYALENHLPVNITFTDGTVGKGLYIDVADNNHMELVPTDEFLRECEEKGHEWGVHSEYDDIASIELAVDEIEGGQDGDETEPG